MHILLFMNAMFNALRTVVSFYLAHKTDGYTIIKLVSSSTGLCEISLRIRWHQLNYI